MGVKRISLKNGKLPVKGKSLYCARATAFHLAQQILGVSESLKMENASILGNPFKDKNKNVIEKYRQFLKHQLNREKSNVKSKLIELKERYENGEDLNLACFCKLDRKCHVDIIIEYIKTGEL